MSLQDTLNDLRSQIDKVIRDRDAKTSNRSFLLSESTKKFPSKDSDFRSGEGVGVVQSEIFNKANNEIKKIQSEIVSIENQIKESISRPTERIESRPDAVSTTQQTQSTQTQSNTSFLTTIQNIAKNPLTWVVGGVVVVVAVKSKKRRT